MSGRSQCTRRRVERLLDLFSSLLLPRKGFLSFVTSIVNRVRSFAVFNSSLSGRWNKRLLPGLFRSRDVLVPLLCHPFPFSCYQFIYCSV